MDADELKSITELLWKAAQALQACRISLEGEPLPRIVYPYGIAQTPRNHIVLVAWQAGGLTKTGGTEGYRNLQLDRIKEVELMERHFEKRSDFNPKDIQYKDWVFHI
jgi:predicted DNA-binding transcriptional regulator YafY